MKLDGYFKETIERKASDLHLIEGSAPTLRISGELIKISQDPILPGELKSAIFSLLNKDEIERLTRKRDIDISIEFFHHHFRVNIHFQENNMGLSARLILKDIPSPEEIGLTSAIFKLINLKDGLVLITGPSGTGKSTTLATMIEMINNQRSSHIITIEDPIEYNFIEKQSIIEQRQLGHDTPSFAMALKYALRQDPNVIMVGEMRDLETISAALTAAKTGHLVLSTLHTSTAPETIQRIVDFFPPHDHQLVGMELSMVLRAVISQQLLPAKNGGLVAAREIMINNRAISNLIKSGQIEQIYSVIQTSQKEGMITMNACVEQLFRDGKISMEVAKTSKRDLETKNLFIK